MYMSSLFTFLHAEERNSLPTTERSESFPDLPNSWQSLICLRLLRQLGKVCLLDYLLTDFVSRAGKLLRQMVFCNCLSALLHVPTPPKQLLHLRNMHCLDVVPAEVL